MTSPRKQSVFAVSAIFLIAVFGALFALNEANRTVVLTTDSIMYIDTARHIAAGQGATTNILEVDSTSVPRPQTQWPPLYSMLIAPLIKLGVGPIEAGRYVSAVSFSILVFLVGVWLMRYHGLTGVAASSLLLAVPGLTKTSAAVWADTPYAVLVLMLCWLGASLIEKPGRYRSLLLGCLVGAAILMKYLGIVLLGVGAAMILFGGLRHRRLRQTITDLGFMIVGVVLFVGPLLAFNLAAGQPIGGAQRTLSSQGLGEIITDARHTVSTDLWATVALRLVVIIAGLAIVFSLFGRQWRTTILSVWRKWLIAPAIVMLAYIVGLIVTRFLIDTDRLHTRFLAPVYPLFVVAAIIFISAATETINRRMRDAFLVVIVLSAMAWTVKAYDFHVGGFHVRETSRATIMRSVSKPQDLIVGNAAREYNLYLGRSVIQLRDDSSAAKLTPELVGALAQRWHGDFRRILIALTPGLDAELYGAYANALSNGTIDSWPPLVISPQLIVYEAPR